MIVVRCPNCGERYRLKKDSLVASMRGVIADSVNSVEVITSGATSEIREILHSLYSQTIEGYRMMGRSPIDAMTEWVRNRQYLARLYVEKIKNDPPDASDLIGHGKINQLNASGQAADFEILCVAREQNVRLNWRCSRCQAVQPYPW